ncbi:hypothetical protein TrVE_jg10924 [Triparma verrucosa]|uniref:3'(2'),5'-bisphosphate nucleotidase n=1 Tax=Triparma verrucosa TaxID=1606542 RepID=A0A9W7KW41_9STRA|nr:hypothetical protein TrVE_jg10924 [Triparma verrucosa]
MQFLNFTSLKACSTILNYHSNRGNANSNLKSVQKIEGDERSVVTQADVDAQKILVESINEKYPHINIIAEEDTGYKRPTLASPTLASPTDSSSSTVYFQSSLLIYIDPLDGTLEYTLGNISNVLCLIGVTSSDGTVIGGVMRAPFGRSFIAYGGNLYEDIDGMIVDYHREEKEEGRLRVCASGSERVRPILDRLREGGAEIDIVGGAGNKISRVIQGTYDIAVFNDRTSLWDTAATEGCLRSLGGTMTDFYGSPLSMVPPVNVDGLVNFRGVIATRPGLDHEAIMEMIQCPELDAFKSCNSSPFCTGVMTSEYLQPTYICMTCSPPSKGGNNCFCPACAVKCHSECEVMYVGNVESGCDCHLLGCCKIREGSERAKRDFTSLGGALANVCIPCPPGEISNFDSFKSYGIKNLPQTLADSCKNLVKKTKETFFLPYPFDDPKTDMEAFAASVFLQHTQNLPIGPGSGAEFWCQVKHKGSPMSIDLHYDKDEYLSENFTLGSFPVFSTVTYLTKSKQPTIVFDHKYEDPEDQVIQDARVSYPKVNKHVVFNGKLLHGAVDDEEFKGFHQGEEEDDCRVTFLVNVWINSRPAIEGLTASDRDLIGPAVTTTEFVKDTSSHVVKIGEENLAGEGITLPFVGAGETWDEEGEEEGEGEEGGLVLAMPSLPGKAESDNVVIKFEEGYEARLVYMGEEGEEYEYEDEMMADIEEEP